MKTGTKLGILALAVALASGALWFHQVRQVDIPEDRTAFIIAFLAAAALGVAALMKGAGWIGRVAAALAIVIGSFLPFTIAISRQEVAANGIQVGQTIPHFTAVDDRGAPFDSDSLHAQPVLMKFFRAHW